MKHTPLPWYVGTGTRWGVIYSQNTKQFVADCTSNPEDVKNDTANAEFILYAVNNIERITKQRDELLEALEDIIKHCKIVNPTGFHLSGFHAIAVKGLGRNE